MQPNLPPPAPATAYPRSRFGLFLALGALVLIAFAGVGGYLIGASGIGHATLRVQVTNNMNSNATVQVTVNGVLAGTLSVPSGQTASMDVPVAYATANGAAFDVEASMTAGPRDSTTVFVNTPGIFVVSLRLG
jgi:hypothetical protein